MTSSSDTLKSNITSTKFTRSRESSKVLVKLMKRSVMTHTIIAIRLTLGVRYLLAGMAVHQIMDSTKAESANLQNSDKSSKKNQISVLTLRPLHKDQTLLL